MTLPPLTVFDVETTGLDPKKGHRIVEIAGVRLEGGVIQQEITFTSFVNPERDIPWEVRQINHIRDEDLKDAPTIMSVLPQFLEFAKGSTLIAHNAGFDMGFLQCEKEFCWGYVELPECLCTMRLSQSLFPSAFRHNLDTLSEKFGFTLPPQRHRALPDVLLTAEVLLKLLDAGNIHSMEELRRRASILGMAPLPAAPKPVMATPKKIGW